MNTETEPLRMTLSANPSKGDPPRDVPRAILKVATETHGVVVEGYHIPVGEACYIEVYEDRIPAVVERTATKADLADIAAAQRLAQNKIEDYLGEALTGFRGGPEQRKAFTEKIMRTCPIHWTQELESLRRDGRLHGDRSDPRSLKLGRSIPELTLCEVVQKGLPAPITPETATRHAHNDLASVLRQVLESVRDGSKAKGSRPKED